MEGMKEGRKEGIEGMEGRNVCMCVCLQLCIYACMHECMYACLHVCMRVGMYVGLWVCFQVALHVCISVCMHARMNASMKVRTRNCVHVLCRYYARLRVCRVECTLAYLQCMFACMCVFVHVRIYHGHTPIICVFVWIRK